MRCGENGNCIENALNTITRPVLNFNFQSSEIHFVLNYGATFHLQEGCFPQKFGT